MAQPLQTASIAAPGFFGLNTQESSITLAAGFALQADNCVIDKYGRLGARKGWQYKTQYVRSQDGAVSIASSGTTATVTHVAHGASSGDTVLILGAVEEEYNGSFEVTVVDADTYTYTIVDNGNTAATGTIFARYSSVGVDLHGMHEFIDINGDRYIGAWSNTTFYIIDGGDLIPVTYAGSSVFSDNGWQAATLNDAAYLFHKDYPPIYFSPLSGQLDDIQNVASNTNKYVPDGNTVLSAYGRLWTADVSTPLGGESPTATVYWSTLLDGVTWQDGTAGLIDLSAVLVNGNDKIVALGAHAGRLIIFLENNVVIYNSDAVGDDSFDPSTMTLVEVISGIGCVARDSVKNTGTDIVFLAKDGLRSLGRLIQEKSQPMRDLSKNVRDDLASDIYTTDTTQIKAVYSATEAFYLLLIPEYKRIYCFDMRSMLQDGSARVTLWDNQTHNNMAEVYDAQLERQELYFTGSDGIADYRGYTDNGETYTIKYYTNYFDFGDATKQKYLKRVSTVVVGGSGQPFIIKAGYDYDDSYDSFPVSIAGQNNSEYGIAEYGANADVVAEYTIGTLSDTVRAPMGGSGGVMQVGFEATIDGSPISIQKLDLYVKQGRVY